MNPTPVQNRGFLTFREVLFPGFCPVFTSRDGNVCPRQAPLLTTLRGLGLWGRGIARASLYAE